MKKVLVCKESLPAETRVALIPDDIKKLTGMGFEFTVVSGAGLKSGFEDADYENCEMIVLPGGLPGATNLLEHKGLKAQIEAFAAAGKWLAAICAAPMVLGAHGVLRGKKATIYPEMEEHLIGAEPTGETVTVDGNVITGQGPALAMEFALQLLEALKGREVRDEVASDMLYE